jgi:endopeptidase Clp ATP-binding regulatory subunit ClpX
MAAVRKYGGHCFSAVSDARNSADGQEPRSIEDQLREMLRKADISFLMGPGMARPRESEKPPEARDPKAADRLQPIREFRLRPRDIHEYLNRFVVKQDDAKKVLSVAICDHYNHVRRCLEDPAFAGREYAKHNIILLGPTGVGKTYLVRCVSKLIGVPFVKADATKFSETGYVGHDVEDLVRDLVTAADGHTELAQYGIIYLDEIDKIASQPSSAGRDVSGRGVQINLLKLMEETDASLYSQTDLVGQMQAILDMQRGRGPDRRTINTRHILFIVSGAFDGLADQVRRRVDRIPIGFGSADAGERSDGDILRLAETRDFIDYGFEPEFIGRLPIRVVCDPLDEDDLERILSKSEDSVLTQYREDFSGYGIETTVTPAAVRAIARLAYAEKTGARGLMTVLERLFRDFKFELPSTPVRAFEVDEPAVACPREALDRLLQSRDSMRRVETERQLREFADGFHGQTGLRLTFAKEAIDAAAEISQREGRPVAAVCSERFADLEYGLRLISRNTGQAAFNITRRFIENPAEELSRRIAASFRKGTTASPRPG